MVGKSPQLVLPTIPNKRKRYSKILRCNSSDDIIMSTRSSVSQDSFMSIDEPDEGTPDHMIIMMKDSDEGTICSEIEEKADVYNSKVDDEDTICSDEEEENEDRMCKYIDIRSE